MAAINDLYKDLTCTPNGNRLFVVTKVEDRPRFNKPDQLLTGRMFIYNDEGNAVFQEDSIRWLSSLQAHIGRVKDANLNIITRDDVE